MQYDKFNPSPLEVKLIEALAGLNGQLEGQLDGLKISKLQTIIDYDHPEVVLTLTDSDGDDHEITLRAIHTPVEDILAQGVAKGSN